MICEFSFFAFLVLELAFIRFCDADSKNNFIVDDCDCFSTENDLDYRCHLAAKTPYRYIANLNDTEFKYRGCEEKKIWLTIRHGTRFPGKKETVQMIDRLESIKNRILESYRLNLTKISEESLEDLNEWELDLRKEDSMKLYEEGENELVDLAERFQNRFKSIFNNIYSNISYNIKYTPTQRTEESAKHFSLGLFGRRGSLDIRYPKINEKDKILRSYKRCERWENEVNNNPKANEEMNLFVKSKIFQNSLKEISNLIGFEIDYDTANLMYSTCSYETAWKRYKYSPWCKFFTIDNLKLMEYVEDLDYYWIDGYGHKITSEQSCPAFIDMFNNFQSETLEPKATIYFSHSGTILKLIALLGLSKDDKILTHDSYEYHVDNREWRVGRIDAFASNIGFVLYECEKEGPSILTIHQERVVDIKGCPKNSPCPLSTIKKLFNKTIDGCNFEEICSI